MWRCSLNEKIILITMLNQLMFQYVVVTHYSAFTAYYYTERLSTPSIVVIHEIISKISVDTPTLGQKFAYTLVQNFNSFY
ncbi:hypothetical protein ACVWXS_002059 [Lysinibacillus sp. TE18511]